MQRIDLSERPGSRDELASWYAAALDEQAVSGLSVAEYAEEIGVTATTLYQWRRRLAPNIEVDHRPTSIPAGLVEVTVESEVVEPDAACTFVVRLGARSVEVPPAFDDASLRRLVTLLESC